MATEQNQNNDKAEKAQQEMPETEANDQVCDDNTAGTDDCEALDTAQKIEQLEAELEKERKDYLFLRADFDNYRKRTLKDREELIRNAGEKALKGILPIVDDFERGLQAAQAADESARAILEGMELIYNKFIKYLNDNGVKAMESTGAAFDPDFHEAIAIIPAPTPELKGKIVDTTQRGYMINDKVLRHAKVVVGE